MVLDPVAVGATRLRREGGKKLLENVKFSVIRGNTSEIKHLAVGTGSTRGVDAAEEDKITEDNYKAFGYMARELARKTGAVIAISGVIDIIASADRVFALRNGDAMMYHWQRLYADSPFGCFLRRQSRSYSGSHRMRRIPYGCQR